MTDPAAQPVTTTDASAHWLAAVEAHHRCICEFEADGLTACSEYWDACQEAEGLLLDVLMPRTEAEREADIARAQETMRGTLGLVLDNARLKQDLAAAQAAVAALEQEIVEWRDARNHVGDDYQALRRAVGALVERIEGAEIDTDFYDVVEPVRILMGNPTIAAPAPSGGKGGAS